MEVCCQENATDDVIAFTVEGRSTKSSAHFNGYLRAQERLRRLMRLQGRFSKEWALALPVTLRAALLMCSRSSSEVEVTVKGLLTEEGLMVGLLSDMTALEKDLDLACFAIGVAKGRINSTLAIVAPDVKI